eukprot:1804342-Prymnesium_polylepis.1
MKPSGGATLFPASSLEPRRQARGYSRVEGGGECDGLGGQKQKNHGRRAAQPERLLTCFLIMRNVS